VPAALALAFLLVPIVEIYLIIQVGQAIGAGWTIALLIADSVLGAWLVRREGRRAWAALQQAIGSGRMPSRELADAGLVLVGGTLLLTPGFVTDAVGFFLVLPVTRPVARRLLGWLVGRRLLGTRRRSGAGPPGRPSPPRGPYPPGPSPYPPGPSPYPPGPRGDRVVPGEIVEDTTPEDGDNPRSRPG
jgi:UPF0716 protein FxsA